MAIVIMNDEKTGVVTMLQNGMAYIDQGDDKIEMSTEEFDRVFGLMASAMGYKKYFNFKQWLSIKLRLSKWL